MHYALCTIDAPANSTLYTMNYALILRRSLFYVKTKQNLSPIKNYYVNLQPIHMVFSQDPWVGLME